MQKIGRRPTAKEKYKCMEVGEHLAFIFIFTSSKRALSVTLSQDCNAGNRINYIPHFQVALNPMKHKLSMNIRLSWKKGYENRR